MRKLNIIMSRTRDFDQEVYVKSVDLSYKDVRVKSIPLKDFFEYSIIRSNNSDIDQFEIIDNTDLPTIHFGIDYKDVPVGEIVLWNIREKDKACMISYWVDKNFRRKKIATYAVALVTDYCFQELDMEEVEAPVLPDNSKSKELLMKLSYTIAGYETFTGKDGVQRSHETYLINKPENGIDISLIDFLEMMAQPPAE